MKLEDTLLCLNCDEVFDQNSPAQCPACGRGPHYKLSNWLQLMTRAKRVTKYLLRGRINMTKAQIDNNFTYHPPSQSQQEKYGFLRDGAKELAYMINALCPESREKSLALTKLEESIMWANASIARNEEGERRSPPPNIKTLIEQGDNQDGGL